MALMGKEVSGKCMGLIGYGSIARETASRAAALGMNIIAYDPYLPKNDPAWKTAQPVELTELLKFADVISLHVPLIDENFSASSVADVTMIFRSLRRPHAFFNKPKSTSV